VPWASGSAAWNVVRGIAVFRDEKARTFGEGHSMCLPALVRTTGPVRSRRHSGGTHGRQSVRHGGSGEERQIEALDRSRGLQYREHGRTRANGQLLPRLAVSLFGASGDGLLWRRWASMAYEKLFSPQTDCEIGIRMAIGAEGTNVRWMVVKQDCVSGGRRRRRVGRLIRSDTSANQFLYDVSATYLLTLLCSLLFRSSAGWPATCRRGGPPR